VRRWRGCAGEREEGGRGNKIGREIKVWRWGARLWRWGARVESTQNIKR
jgi:hypothetical protein